MNAIYPGYPGNPPVANVVVTGSSFYNAQQIAQQYSASRAHRMAHGIKDWRIDGVDMDFMEFVNTLYPEDCAEKTYLILKFKKEQ